MGLEKEAILLLMHEGLKNPFKGRIVTLGKQDIYVTFEELKDLAHKIGYTLKNRENIEFSEKPEMQKCKMLSDRSLFELLGFEELISIDASSYENADVIYDLNEDNLPNNLIESSHVVLDAGTIEHVFHVPNSLKNIFRLLQNHGRVIHISPSSNHIDHGFYMFSPIFFFNFYTTNKFELQPLKIIRYKTVFSAPWKIAHYLPGTYDAYCGLADEMYAIYCVATKTSDSSFNLVPQQFHYEQIQWKQTPTSQSKLKEFIKKSPLLYQASQYAYRFYKRNIFKRKFERLITK